MPEHETGEHETGARETDGATRIDAETRRQIDVLMAEPPKGLPAIVVFGDDAVFGITPAKRPG